MKNRASPLISAASVNSTEETNQVNDNSENDKTSKVIPIFDPTTFQEISEKTAEKKSTDEATQKSKLEVFFTKDKNLLSQYYDLRADAYQKEWGFEDFDKSENNFDRQGVIAVATRGGKVIGGMRLMFSDGCNFLSNELPGTQYDYKKFIKKYDDREGLIIAEISAIVVADGDRDSAVSTAMFDHIFKEAVAHGSHYVFGVTVPIVCRRNRRTLKQIGYDLEIVINYPWEKKRIYNFSTMFPIYVKLL